MPYQIKKKGKGYEVINSQTGLIHAKNTTKGKALGQLHLLQGLKEDLKQKHKMS